MKSPFKVWFGLRNMGVAPAGVDKPDTGHHHLLINADLPPMNEPIPNNRTHLHFGGGQTETVLDLPPGKYTLQLILARQGPCSVRSARDLQEDHHHRALKAGRRRPTQSRSRATLRPLAGYRTSLS